MNYFAVKELDKLLEGKLKDLTTEPFTTIHMLGKLKAKQIHVVNFKALDDLKKRNEIYIEIAELEGNNCVLVDSFENDSYLEIMQDLSENILTINYKFDKFKTKKEDKSKDKDFFYYGETAIYEAVKKGFVYGECMNHAKDLVNTPYNYLNATDLANYAKDLEKYENINVTIYNKSEIEDMNMGAYLGVNKGSLDEPKRILVKYQGKATFEDPTALVGKGVMYDTGGYSLKSSLKPLVFIS